MKEILKAHLLTILCAISLVAMFLPFATVSVNMEIAGTSAGSSQSLTGFAAAQEGILGYILIIGPVLLIAMNYVKQLEKYKSLLAIAIPAICIIVCIVVMLQAKSLAVKTMGYASDGTFGMDVKTSLAIGSILAMLSYIGTAVVGATTYHNLTLNKEGLNRLKQEGTQFLQSAQSSLTEAAQNVSEAAQTVSAKVGEAKVHIDAPEAKPAVRKSVNLSRTDEVLAMIEKLSKMKDAGILTEEEFSEKKQQLLSEI